MRCDPSVGHEDPTEKGKSASFLSMNEYLEKCEESMINPKITSLTIWIMELLLLEEFEWYIESVISTVY